MATLTDGYLTFEIRYLLFETPWIFSEWNFYCEMVPVLNDAVIHPGYHIEGRHPGGIVLGQYRGDGWIYNIEESMQKNCMAEWMSIEETAGMIICPGYEFQW